MAWGEAFREHWGVDEQKGGKEGVMAEQERARVWAPSRCTLEERARVWGALAMHAGREGMGVGHPRDARWKRGNQLFKKINLKSTQGPGGRGP